MRTSSPNAKPNYAPFFWRSVGRNYSSFCRKQNRERGGKGGENSTAITGFISLSSPSSHTAPAMQGNTPHKLSASYSTRKYGENCMRKKKRAKVGNKCALISLLYFSVAELSQMSPTNNPRTAEEDKKGKNRHLQEEEEEEKTK